MVGPNATGPPCQPKLKPQPKAHALSQRTLASQASQATQASVPAGHPAPPAPVGDPFKYCTVRDFGDVTQEIGFTDKFHAAIMEVMKKGDVQDKAAEDEVKAAEPHVGGDAHDGVVIQAATTGSFDMRSKVGQARQKFKAGDTEFESLYAVLDKTARRQERVKARQSGRPSPPLCGAV